jgi:flagellar biogenesis protein FliO
MENVSQFLSVALVLGLLGLAAWRFRSPRVGSARLWARRGDGRMRVLERVVLTPHHSLHLVSIGGNLLLLGAGPSGIELIRQASGGDGGKTIG